MTAKLFCEAKSKIIDGLATEHFCGSFERFFPRSKDCPMANVVSLESVEDRGISNVEKNVRRNCATKSAVLFCVRGIRNQNRKAVRS